MIKYYATGRRKLASAKIWISVGSGKIYINKKRISSYFNRLIHEVSVMKPFTTIDTNDKYDVFASVRGGGHSGQSMAISHGISRALVKLNGNFRKSLKKEGLLTRDSRMVERKKYGRAGSRKKFQYSKR